MHSLSLKISEWEVKNRKIHKLKEEKLIVAMSEFSNTFSVPSDAQIVSNFKRYSAEPRF